MKQEWFRGSHTIDTLHMRYVYIPIYFIIVLLILMWTG